MGEQCEWNPVLKCAATDQPGNGCTNEAKIGVGRGKNNWHLCESCASLTEFKHFSKRPLQPRLMWRVGTKVPLNVYEGDRPVCQCHSVEDARRIVEAMNGKVR